MGRNIMSREEKVDLGNVRGQSGLNGQDGVGISEIVDDGYDNSGFYHRWLIYYDDDREPSSFTVKDGENVVPIHSVVSNSDEPVSSRALYTKFLTKAEYNHTHRTVEVFLVEENNGQYTQTNKSLHTKLGEIDGAIDELQRHELIKIVQQLPNSNIDTKSLYLVPTSTELSNNLFEEYIYTNNRWEHIGNLNFNISNYYTKTEADNLLNGKQATLVSGTNLKTINNSSLLSSGNLSLQPTLVSGTNIKSINNSSILSSGNLNLQVPLVSGTNIKTINNTSLLGSGNISLQTPLVSGTSIKTINNNSILGSGNISLQEQLVNQSNIKSINGTSILGAGNLSVTLDTSMYYTKTQIDNLIGNIIDYIES